MPPAANYIISFPLNRTILSDCCLVVEVEADPLTG